MNAEDFVATVSLPIQHLGALHYFDPKAKAAAETLGIDQFRFYFAGRGGVMGAVDSVAVQAAFGFFNPALVDKMWSSSKERCDVTAAGAAQLQVAYDIADEQFGEVAGLSEAASALSTLTSSVDVAALPLFAAFSKQPLPESPAPAFMHQVILFRELRGSIHLAAISATGCSSRAAHQIKRPNDLQMFGYEETIDISEAEHARYAQVEPLTDRAMIAHCDAALTGEERAQIAATVTSAEAAIA